METDGLALATPFAGGTESALLPRRRSRSREPSPPVGKCTPFPSVVAGPWRARWPSTAGCRAPRFYWRRTVVASGAWNPAFLWEPSQSGLEFEWPQRQRAVTILPLTITRFGPSFSDFTST